MTVFFILYGVNELYLKDNVYFVEGRINAAFYDLNSGDLFQVTEESKILILKVLNDSNCKLQEEEERFIEELVRLNLLTDKYTCEHSIESFKKKTNIDFVWIEITNMCNLKCVHCYDEAMCSLGKIMPLHDFKHIVDELVNYGIKKLQIIGGEPFILKDGIIDYLDYCIGKFEYIEIFTNGTLITDENLNYIKKNNIHIALSIYSYIEAEHNKVTNNNDSWRKTNETIKKLSELGIKYRVKNVLMKDLSLGEKNTDLYELSKVKDIARLTGRADMNLLSDELIKKKLITEEKLLYKISAKLIEKCISGHNCFSRRLYFSVDSDVFPCVMERRLLHGNIKGKTLKDIINPEILCFNKDKVDECNECEFRYCCFDCRPDSNGKDKNSKPWYCTYQPYKGVWEKDINSFVSKLRLL